MIGCWRLFFKRLSARRTVRTCPGMLNFALTSAARATVNDYCMVQNSTRSAGAVMTCLKIMVRKSQTWKKKPFGFFFIAENADKNSNVDAAHCHLVSSDAEALLAPQVVPAFSCGRQLQGRPRHEPQREKWIQYNSKLEELHNNWLTMVASHCR